MVLVENGDLDIEQPVTDFLPSFGNLRDCPMTGNRFRHYVSRLCGIFCVIRPVSLRVSRIEPALDSPLIVLFEQDQPTRRTMASSLGKMPSTSVRRLISPLRRSIGLAECSLVRCFAVGSSCR